MWIFWRFAAAVVLLLWSLCCCRWSPLVAALLLCSAALGFDVATLVNIILIIEQHLSTNSGRGRWARKIWRDQGSVWSQSAALWTGRMVSKLSARAEHPFNIPKHKSATKAIDPKMTRFEQSEHSQMLCIPVVARDSGVPKLELSFS